MKYVFIIMLFLVSIACSQFQMHNYTLSHNPNPPADSVSQYIYWYWEGNDFNACPLQDNMTYEEVMAIPQTPITITMTHTPTLISGTLSLQENGFWHRAGAIAENTRGQRSLMAVSPFMMKPRILTNITKMTSFILNRNP